jgi:uncharacterized protein
LIERTYYTNKIQPYVGKDLIKVLTGQRRVGKSALLQLLADMIKRAQPDAHIMYIDKEDYAYDFLKTHNDLYNYIEEKKANTNNFLFIDEVQEIEGFEKILRNYNRQAEFDIYCTGSNAKMFSGELATYLSGRQVIINIGSLSFNEFCTFHQLERNQEALQKYMKYGGLPYLMHLPDDENIRFEYLKNIFDTILLRDIIHRNQIRDPRFLNDLLRFLGDATGSVFSANKIAKYLKSQQINKNVALILNYLNYIEDAFFINKVTRVDIQGKRQFEVGEKYYFEDVGLRNAITGYKVQDIEKVIENMVFLHLKNSGYTVHIGFWGGKEIDFVAEKDNERIYVQVAYLLNEPKTVEREFGNLLQIKDNYPKYVVSFDVFESKNTWQGIKHYRLLDFLKSFK